MKQNDLPYDKIDRGLSPTPASASLQISLKGTSRFATSHYHDFPKIGTISLENQDDADISSSKSAHHEGSLKKIDEVSLHEPVYITERKQKYFNTEKNFGDIQIDKD